MARVKPKRADDLGKTAERAIDGAVSAGSAVTGEAGRAVKGIGKIIDETGRGALDRSLKTLDGGLSAAKGATGVTERDLQFLERLGELREAGVLTEEEFAEQKKKILDRL